MIKLATIAIVSILTIVGVSTAQPKEDLTQIDRAETKRLLEIKEVVEEVPSYIREFGKTEQLEPEELKQLLHDVGFTGQALKEAWGTAMRESTGRPRSHNDNRNTGDNSYGLFQINMIDSLGPARLKQYGLNSNEDLFDPVTNAKIAYQMSDGGNNWSAWKGITESAQKWMKEFPE
jgi:hypothetical protein